MNLVAQLASFREPLSVHHNSQVDSSLQLPQCAFDSTLANGFFNASQDHIKLGTSLRGRQSGLPTLNLKVRHSQLRAIHDPSCVPYTERASLQGQVSQPSADSSPKNLRHRLPQLSNKLPTVFQNAARRCVNKHQINNGNERRQRLQPTPKRLSRVYSAEIIREGFQNEVFGPCFK